MRYISQNLKIEIYINKNDIDSSDKLYLYETTDDPSTGGTKIATLTSFETDDDPSTGDSYLFTYTKRVSTPNTYSFYYVPVDPKGNEGSQSDPFDLAVCLIPATPDSLIIANIDTNITFNL
ncbi:MAG: hypothetical protein KAX49_12980 [Halanaerobiales bacterium]|nr:hypothetical protein [Halanaerobiales bacterium]